MVADVVLSSRCGQCAADDWLTRNRFDGDIAGGLACIKRIPRRSVHLRLALALRDEFRQSVAARMNKQTKEHLLNRQYAVIWSDKTESTHAIKNVI